MTSTSLLTPTTSETFTKHPLNFYESPWWFTTELLRHVKLSGVIGEPCVGHGAIASLLQAWPYTNSLWTNDIDPKKQADYHLDATLAEAWDEFPPCDWICTNPPFGVYASPIIKNAFNKARIGVAAFLLTSFLEPCDDRADFLLSHPPSSQFAIINSQFAIIILYINLGTLIIVSLHLNLFSQLQIANCELRIANCFTRWSTDNITISCFVWDKRATGQSIIIRPKSEIMGFYKNPECAIAKKQAVGIVAAIAHGEISTNYV